MATEQTLQEQNQLLRKQLEDMNAQMQTIMAQLQGNIIAQSSQASQEALPNLEMANAEAVVLIETAQQKNKRVTDHKAPYRGNYQPQNNQPVNHPQPSLTPESLIQAPKQEQAQIQQRNNRPTLRYTPPPVPQVYTPAPRQQAPIQRRNAMQIPQYPPLPISQEDFYRQLVEEGLLNPVPTRPYTPPYPTWFDQNVKCAYHSGVMGHSTENCAKLRQKLYELINAGSIKLNLVKKEILKTNDQIKINFIREEEDDQETEEICWPGKQREEAHVAIIGDDPILPNTWKM